MFIKHELICLHDGTDEKAVLFLRESFTEGKFINRFSVGLQQNGILGSRAFVTYDGEDDGSGQWSCSKDAGIDCMHINIARKQFQQLLHGNPEADDDFINSSAPPLIRSIGKFSFQCIRILLTSVL